MDYAEHLMLLFREKGAYLEGHFQLSSGLHSPSYIQCARVLQFPSLAAELGQRLAANFSDVDLVLSPAMGGIIIGHEVARALNVRFLFCERVENQFQLRRGFQIEAGQRVVVVEDVVTTGLSTGETIAVAERAAGRVVGVAAIVNRSTEPLPFSVPFHSLLTIPLATHDPDTCPLCRQNIPLVKPGSRPK